MDKIRQKKKLRYYQIAEGLLSGLSKTELAKKMNISRATLYLILQESEFIDFYERFCNELYQSLKNSYIRLVRLTIENIEKYLKDNNIKISEKVKICLGILRSCNVEIKF